MKIFYVYSSLLTKGGADRILTIKANWLAAQGHEVAIVTDSQHGLPPVFPLSERVRLIDLAINFDEEYRHSLPVRFLLYHRLMRRYRCRLSQLLSAERPDIVITTLGREMDFLTSIKDGSKKIGESHIARRYSRNFHLLEQRGVIHKMVVAYWRRKQAREVSRLDALVLLTKNDEESWRSVTPHTLVIPNPLTFSAPPQRGRCEGKNVLAVGRLSEQKGFDLLISAWKSVAECHPDWHLDIFGEGEQKEELLMLIGREKLDNNITIHPPTDRIADEYVNHSFYVMSSRFEGFGLVLTEAMLCGLPCISFDCPYGPRDIIKDGDDGLLVSHLSVPHLSEAICRLIEDEELRKTMGQRAYEHVQRYSEEQVMPQWLQLFSRLRGGENS